MIDLKRNIRIRTVCADSDGMISKCLENGIDLLHLIRIDLLTNEFTIKQKDMNAVNGIIKKYSGSLRVVGRNDFIMTVMRLVKRPVLLCSVILFAMMLVWTSGRVFFIRVVGNKQVPTGAILSQLQLYGLEFGTKAANLRNEELKNAILSDFPQLQWFGITTFGSVATIEVVERSLNENVITEKPSYLGIYASRDGVISKVIVEKGNPLVQIGQKVKKGDLLVSGYTDCGILIRAEKPIAEVFAYTLRRFTACTPKSFLIREECTGKHSCYKIRIGKKVINFCNHSGNHDALCVKMYEEKYCTLPGGFQLPLSVIKVSYQQYRMTSTDNLSAPDSWMPQYMRKYLRSQMVAGEVLDEEIVLTDGDHIHILTGSYACQEMIGQVTNEETIENYAEDS